MPKVLVIHTKLTPPRLPRRVLQRPRLTTRLLEALDYRLTILQAGTGYGKSTALAARLRHTLHRSTASSGHGSSAARGGGTRGIHSSGGWGNSVKRET